MYQEGMLIQTDGSHHRWLGESGPQLALLLAIDDATGKVLAARMRPSEDARGYFDAPKRPGGKLRHSAGALL